MTRTLSWTRMQMEAARDVAENTPAGSAIGDPVVAEDEDGDILTYTLTGEDFDIDMGHGPAEDQGCAGLRDQVQLHRHRHGHRPDGRSPGIR